MDKQSIIGLTLIGAIFFIWMFYTSSHQPPKTQPVSGDSVTHVQQNKPVNNNKIVDKKVAVNNDSLSLGDFYQPKSAKNEILTVETDLAIYELTSKGGNIHKVFLKKYKNWESADKKDSNNFYKTGIQLLNNDVSFLDLDFTTVQGKAVNTKKLNFTKNIKDYKVSLSGSDSLVLEYTFAVDSSKNIKKVYTFYGDKYNVETEFQFNGMADVISSNSFDLKWENGVNFVEHNSVDEANYANSSVFYGDEQVIYNAGDELKTPFMGKVDWLTIRNKYFTGVIAPRDPGNVISAEINGYKLHQPNNGLGEIYNGIFTVPLKKTNSEKFKFFVYLGPVDYAIMSNYDMNLEKIVDFGSFFGLKFIVRPIAEYLLLPLFKFLHMIIPNYGLVLILFALIMKFVLYPLTKQSMYSMKKMQLLQPKITEIKEKYKDDQTKVSQETMKLYSTYGINPAGGCLPLLLQMPIFVALWGTFQTAIELRQQSFIWWITDLSQPDVILSLPFHIPLVGVQFISGLALLMGITTFIQQKQTVKDPSQQAMIYIMPVMLTLMFMSFPAGLNLYYFMFNLFSIAQQYYINHTNKDMVLEPVAPNKKKKGFMQRMMEAAEQNAKTQQQKRKK